MLESLIRLSFLKDFDYFEEDQLYFKNPLDCVPNNSKIFFFQKSFFFFKTPIIAAYSKMHFILISLNYFINYYLNFFIYL
jgi:hypothetical protein